MYGGGKLDIDQRAAKHLPLTEATYYILTSPVEPLHGYGVMQNVAEISRGKVRFGPGTLHGALSKLEQFGLIIKAAEETDNGARRMSSLNSASGWCVCNTPA